MFVLLIVWPVAELYVAIKIAEAIGVLWMLVLLIASLPLGIWALRSQGAAAWRRFAEAASVGRAPGREVLDGALIVAGGLLMVIPGFITDAVALCLLLGPTRAVLRHLIVRNLHSRIVVRAAHATRRRTDYDVDSTAHDAEPSRLRR